MTSPTRTLSASRSLVPRFVYGQREPLICITFDDGVASDYTIAFSEMAARGMAGTSYVNSGSIGSYTRMSWSNIREMRDTGWAVECHAHTHTNLTTLSEAEIKTQMQNVNTAFQDNGFKIPEHHAFPYGGRDATVITVVAGYRNTARKVGGVVNDWATINYNDMNSQNFYLDTQETLDNIKTVVDETVNNCQILILYTHEIHPTVFPSGGCLQPLFEDLLDYILTKNARVVTIPQMYKLVEYWSV